MDNHLLVLFLTKIGLYGISWYLLVTLIVFRSYTL